MSQSIPVLSEKAAEESQPQVWFVYIIENGLNQLYTGITTDPKRRLSEHRSNTKKGAKSLRGKGPLTLRYCQSVATKSSALKIEYWIKQQPRQTKLKIIEGTSDIPLVSVGEHTRDN